MKKKIIITTAALLATGITLAGCAGTTPDNGKAETSSVSDTQSTAEITTSQGQIITNLEKLYMSKWQYNESDDVYYQIGIAYCENPADEEKEKLAVFVPGAYMKAVDNGDGTYTCELRTDSDINGYTAETAPIVMPINTPGYSSQAALTSYTSEVTEYTKEGFIYVHAGCRGRDEGAPAGVTDLKAAIRYLRYTDDHLAGSGEKIFVFGMSGGGTQSAIVGATGDSKEYDPYLEGIGAVKGTSDAVLGSMDWCPITNLDSADAAYEWMMGSTRSGLSDEEQQISDKLAESFAEYVNEAGFTDESGNALTLESSDEGIYQAGSYYEYIKKVIEESLNNFLSDTTFPYDASSSGQTGGPGGNMQGAAPGNMTGGRGPGGNQSGNMSDNISRTENSGGLSLTGTYETAQDYIDALNEDSEWVSYDAGSNTATITSIEDFVKAFKNASKSLGAFDQLDSGQGENTLFGYGDGSGAHFDQTLADILSELGSSYASEYKSDLEKKDSAGNTAEDRLNMYTPLYYLLESEEGYSTSTVAKYWRIRTGIAQSDTSLTTEVNLALALENIDSVEDVDFETVWGQGHTQAERSGSSDANFIEWVHECLK